MPTETIYPANFKVLASPKKIIFKMKAAESEDFLISENIKFNFRFQVCSLLTSPKEINISIVLSLLDSDFFSFETGEQSIEKNAPLTIGFKTEETFEVNSSIKIKNAKPFNSLPQIIVRFSALLLIEDSKREGNSFHDFELIKTISA